MDGILEKAAVPSGNPLLIITSGRHRVDTELVAKNLAIAELGRADANYVKEVSGYSVGGVPPVVFVSKRNRAGSTPLPLGKLLLKLGDFSRSFSCRFGGTVAFVGGGI